jgi:hypothetical protein
MFRAWTLVLVAWVVLAARELGGNATPERRGVSEGR